MKDPLDNGRTGELPFEEPSEFTPNADEKITEAILTSIPEAQPGAEVTVNGEVYKVEGPEFKPTLTPEEIEKALADVRGKSFSARNPELGKMINCPVHGFRHRQFEYNGLKGCEQKFTNVVGDYEYYREVPAEDEPGQVKLVPALRTAIDPEQQPTHNQVNGSPRRVNWAKPRYNPHPSKIKLLFIEETRRQYVKAGFDPDVSKEQFQKDLHRARVLAARVLRKQREFADREVRRSQDASRRINRGLIVKIVAATEGIAKFLQRRREKKVKP